MTRLALGLLALALIWLIFHEPPQPCPSALPWLCKEITK